MHDHIKLDRQYDMAIFCGDMSNSFDLAKSEVECRRFLDWYNEAPFKYKLLIPGNHDRAIEHKWVHPDEYKELTWFFNETKIIDDLKIFGSPYTPVYGKCGAYMYNRKDAHKYWHCIEEGTDIVITHGPPLGILDLADHNQDRSLIAQVGCRTLYKTIDKIRPKLHCFGHIHSTDRFNNRGIYSNDNTAFINAACFNHTKNVFYQGISIN
jgi:Icc-related predicted phosphoesterase